MLNISSQNSILLLPLEIDGASFEIVGGSRAKMQLLLQCQENSKVFSKKATLVAVWLISTFLAIKLFPNIIYMNLNINSFIEGHTLLIVHGTQ